MNIFDVINKNLDSKTILVIALWVVSILVAGFIAQFGKRFADYLTDKIRNTRRKTPGSTDKPPSSGKGGAEPARRGNEEPQHIGSWERALLKKEKKQVKALNKQEKKK